MNAMIQFDFRLTVGDIEVCVAQCLKPTVSAIIIFVIALAIKTLLFLPSEIILFAGVREPPFIYTPYRYILFLSI